MPNDLIALRVHFDDDTYEDRPATAGCVITPFGDPPPRPPNDLTNLRCLSTMSPPYASEWLFCGHIVRLLGQQRGARVWVWRITGGTDENEPLVGEWVACRVETAEEQVRRLSAELAEARAASMTTTISGLKLFVAATPFLDMGGALLDRAGAWTSDLADAFGKDPPAAGLWVWEGSCEVVEAEGDKPRMTFLGEWRSPTGNERVRLECGFYPLREYEPLLAPNSEPFEVGTSR